ncbi:Ig-like domain-containing protein [Gottfriedia acidiceleris]|uniref:Ig-like domain-containing protein n=1 Tax=Gottfriedia acidiceleris TaxID=371036 RepID=UPI002F26B3F2
MMKKGILSLATLGLLASPLSFTTAHAEGNNSEAKNMFRDRQFNNLSVKPNFNPYNKSQTFGVANYSAAAEDDYDYLDEIESNDTFDSADKLPFEIDMFGQLLPNSDIDYHKVVVPSDGLVYISGSNYSDNIDLKFNIFEKDRANTGKIKLLENDYDDFGEYYIVQIKAGTYYVGVWDGDKLNNNTEDDEYSVYTEFYDNVAPTKPTVNKVDNNDVVVTGKAEANSTVTVKNGSTVLGSAKATSTGTYSVKIPVQKAGVTLSVYAKDSTGNTSVAATTKVVDVIAPAKPIVNRVDNNDVVVTGKAEANSTVTVKNGSTVLGTPTKATSTGTYSVKIPVQKAGVTLSVYAKDAAGNTSVAGTTKVVDVIAPSKPTVNRVDNNDKVVTGKAEANSTVTVKKGTTILGTVKATSTGTFSVTIPVQYAGTTLTVTAKDAAGNVSAGTSVVVVDVIPPSKPTINRVDDNDLKVTGKAEKGSIVTVKKGTTVLGSATTNTSGVYSVSIKAQKKGTVISVTAKDKAGNTSAAATYTVVQH